MRTQLHIDLPDDLLPLTHCFTNAGHKLYLVGGAVRDAVMGTTPKDFDLATDATPDRVIELLTRRGYRLIEVGKSFGVVKALTLEGNEYEVATFRQDVGAGRRPESVVFTTIEEDVKRRDLTINALFYDLSTHEVVDLVGGMDDIHNRVIKTVGYPIDRFEEDRLRILRAVRFAARYDWAFDPTTEEAIRSVDLFGVSAERIRDEFLKSIVSAKRVDELFAMISRFELWNDLLPGLRVSIERIEGLNNRCVPALLATVLDENDPVLVAKCLNTLKYTADEVAQVGFFMRFKDLCVENAYRLKKQFHVSKLSNEDMLDYVSLRGLPSFKLFTSFMCYEPTIDGKTLLDEGFGGKRLGDELERRETVRFKMQLEGSKHYRVRGFLEELDFNRYAQEGEGNETSTKPPKTES